MLRLLFQILRIRRYARLARMLSGNSTRGRHAGQARRNPPAAGDIPDIQQSPGAGETPPPAAGSSQPSQPGRGDDSHKRKSTG